MHVNARWRSRAFGAHALDPNVAAARIPVPALAAASAMNCAAPRSPAVRIHSRARGAETWRVPVSLFSSAFSAKYSPPSGMAAPMIAQRPGD